MPRWRMPAGIAIIIGIIVVWAVLVASASDTIGGWPWPVQALFYIVAGLVWILPLKPLLRWMETGRWR